MTIFWRVLYLTYFTRLTVLCMCIFPPRCILLQLFVAQVVPETDERAVDIRHGRHMEDNLDWIFCAAIFIFHALIFQHISTQGWNSEFLLALWKLVPNEDHWYSSPLFPLIKTKSLPNPNFSPCLHIWGTDSFGASFVPVISRFSPKTGGRLGQIGRLWLRRQMGCRVCGANKPNGHRHRGKAVRLSTVGQIVKHWEISLCVYT